MSSDAPRTAAGTGVTVLTLYVEGTGTSGARYAGVEQAPSNPASAGRILRMGTTLIPRGPRWTPAVERFYIIRLSRGLLMRPVDGAADENIEERREEKSKERDAKHSREHGDTHHPPHLRACSTRDDEWNDTGY